MASKEKEVSSSTNSDASPNNSNSQKDSSQLSDSFHTIVDSLNLLSAQEDKILKNEDKKRAFDSSSLFEETASESRASSHDFDTPVLKINTQTNSAVNKNVSSPQLSSFSFKPSDRKERKLYKIMHKKNTDNSGLQHDPLTDTSQSLPAQKTSKPRQIPFGSSKVTRGRKKKSTNDAILSKNTNQPLNSPGLFSDNRIFFIPNNIDKVRLRLLKQKVRDEGGQVVEDGFDASVTHVITSLEGQRVLEILGINDNNIPQDVFIVEPNWISQCLMRGELTDVRPYIVQTSDTQPLEQSDKRIHDSISDNDGNKKNNRPKKKQRQDSLSPKMRSPSPSLEIQESSSKTINTQDDDPLLEMIAETKCLAEAGFLLDDDDDDDSRSIQGSKMSDSEDEILVSSMQDKTNNPNQLIIDKLQVLLNHYRRMKDEWRTLSYRKAISAIKKQKDPITSYEDAIKIPGIGHRTAEKIAEIVNTGNLKRLQHFSESDEVVKKFGDIFGVGAFTAMKWYAKGYRTFDDIIKNVDLTHAQRIGIEYFDELQEKILRDEVTEISNRVKEAAYKVDPDLLCIPVGSYIRGQPTCGDIDILITKKNDGDGKINYGAFSKLLAILHEEGLLTHDLTQPHGKEKVSSKYYGLCKLPGGKHHQIDFFIVPFNELGAALLAYTGNDIFNRSIRLLAKKKKMNLNHHGLYKNVSRSHGKSEGVLIAQRTEKEIFDGLGIPWRPPSERNF
ncbi:12111_t:CDS:10 [Dentiscutata erythropus]|uniref:DNA polymerase lambda n=1 Tax=Dentiscutata erythropus TaxID=1348616 RepID=A0A9N9NEI2_9GLOM|nr:12111_t:CDS:10 [Dentiscutata erythropus]